MSPDRLEKFAPPPPVGLRAGAKLSLWVLACLLATCGGERPRWIELARGFEPQPIEELVLRWEAADGATGNTTRAVEAGVGIEHELVRSDWTREEGTDDWLTALPRGAFRHGSERFTRLTAEGLELERFEGGRLDPGEYAFEGEEIRLRLESGAEPPPSAKLHQRLENGLALDGRWHVRAAGMSGDGIPVYSGEREELVCDIPPGSCLSFLAMHASRPPVHYRVRLDGEIFFEKEETNAGFLRSGKRYSRALPPEGQKRARLTFEIDSPTGFGVFFQPIIGPAEVGSYGFRPWPDARPDMVLFLADTFRADNLACYGGDPGLTPNLNALAERSLRFQHARSTAAWTLPSISSLLSGLYPGQHGATEKGDSLPYGIETLPELLRRAGYRTGAVTDASFFSSVFQMNQGFEWFQEHVAPEWNLEHTIDEALEFLDQDDGRPTFLLVHTYRTHQPYRAGTDEDASAYQAIQDEGVQAFEQGDSLTAAAGRELQLAKKDEYRRLYRAGVRGLDRSLGRFFASLKDLGFPARGYLLFTSDHGEALGENQDMFHGGHLWEIKLRVPLLMSGPDLVPGDIPWTTTNVDLAPTLAALARIPSDSTWPGTSLLSLASERPVYAFQLEKRRRQISILDGQRKIITLRPPETLHAGECDEAYELASDPGEEQNRAGDAEWPAELVRKRAGATLELLEARATKVQASMDPEIARQLRGLGY